MLECLLAVSQDILAHVTEVDIEFTVVTRLHLRVRQLRIHQPELDILDIRFLEIRIVNTPHDTGPTLGRIGQLTVGSDLVRTDVILSAFVRVVRQVQYRQLRIYVTCLLTVRVYLVLINDTRTMVTQRLQVIANMRRRIRLRVSENRIDGVPCQVRTVLVIPDRIAGDIDMRLREDVRRRSQDHRYRLFLLFLRHSCDPG